VGPRGQRGGRSPLIYLLLLTLLAAYHLLRWGRTPPTRQNPARPRPFATDAPRVSFLVPAWNAAEEIPGFVASFLGLDYPHKELILCVGGKDDSLAVATGLAQPTVTVREQLPGEGKQGALAKSFAVSTGSVLYLTDIDCRLDTASLGALLAPILRGEESAVTGTSKPRTEQLDISAVMVHWAVERKAVGNVARPVDGMLGRNCALTRAAAEAIGAFTYAAPTGTDFRMAQRLQKQGYRIWLEPESTVETAFPWPFDVYLRKQARWLRNVVLYAERPRQLHELLGALIVLVSPFALLLLLVATLLLNSLIPAFVVLLLLLHAILNRFHHVHETLGRPLSRSVVLGSALNLLATLAAGIYASFTLMTPALRRQW
jgi:cellulose synthase/poly-beta-1,6-N-acetylglucosamine synthase-like glycosyltransferase